MGSVDAAVFGEAEIRARTLGLLERVQDRLEDQLEHSSDIAQVVSALRSLAQVTKELQVEERDVDEESERLRGEARRLVEEVWRGCPVCEGLREELAAAKRKKPVSRSRKKPA